MFENRKQSISLHLSSNFPIEIRNAQFPHPSKTQIMMSRLDSIQSPNNRTFLIFICKIGRLHCSSRFIVQYFHIFHGQIELEKVHTFKSLQYQTNCFQSLVIS